MSIVFLSAVRTPFGTFGGALKDLTATDLAVHAARAAIERAGVPATTIDATVFGNVLQTSGDAVYYARHVALRAGCRIESPALTVSGGHAVFPRDGDSPTILLRAADRRLYEAKNAPRPEIARAG